MSDAERCEVPQGKEGTRKASKESRSQAATLGLRPDCNPTLNLIPARVKVITRRLRAKARSGQH